jgi:peptidoglycan/xylan/chitin deacetylase (PgdA/CDA1 family)
MPGYSLEEWHGMILEHLKEHEVSAFLFAAGKSLDNPKGKYVLESWKREGHLIGNHTYSHPNFNDPEVSLEDYQKDFLQNMPIVSSYSNFKPYFRFPYLKEGNTVEKRDGFREFLVEQGFRNGHVSIDGSDWYISSRVVNRLKENPNEDMKAFRDFYLDHHLDRALFYDSLATQLTGRKIDHVLLLHHNLAASLFLGDLIRHFKASGWEVLDVEEAFQDLIYTESPDILHVGECLIWAMAKATGKYDEFLRYPAETGDYLKEKMDKLGL